MMKLLALDFLFVVCLILCSSVLAADIDNSEIYTVTDENRYFVQNPNLNPEIFNKVKHVKGNYLFTSGDRISGDRLFLTFFDETQFTKSADIEVLLKYPAASTTGYTITSVEIYADISSDDADVFFTEGGINLTHANMLLACNQTTILTYELYMYGY